MFHIKPLRIHIVGSSRILGIFSWNLIQTNGTLRNQQYSLPHNTVVSTFRLDYLQKSPVLLFMFLYSTLKRNYTHRWHLTEKIRSMTWTSFKTEPTLISRTQTVAKVTSNQASVKTGGLRQNYLPQGHRFHLICDGWETDPSQKYTLGRFAKNWCGLEFVVF